MALPLADGAAATSGEATLRIPRGWLFAGYAALLWGLVRAFGVTWGEVSPVQQVVHFDAQASRWYLVHLDSPAARVSAVSEHDGIHLRASGLRDAGAGLVVRAPVLVVEHACPVGVPHRHSDVVRADQLAITLQARSQRPKTSLVVSTGGGLEFRYAQPIPLDQKWRDITIPISEMERGGLAFPPLVSGVPQVILAFHPPTDIDAWVRMCG